MASGHQSGRSRVFKQANESVMHALRYAYFHRREKKGDMRRLWNIRINAAARANGLSYSKLIHGLKLAGVDVNRKMLAELGATDPEAFTAIAETAKAQLASEAA
jgi:large subunit ribosomal protein L20